MILTIRTIDMVIRQAIEVVHCWVLQVASRYKWVLPPFLWESAVRPLDPTFTLVFRTTWVGS